MKYIVKFLLILQPLGRRLTLCQLTGSIAGIIAGIILVFLYLAVGEMLIVSGDDFWKLSLIVSSCCWLALLFILRALCRYSLRSILFPSLVNCIITCTLTVWVCNYLQRWYFAPLIGMLIGMAVGSVLCYLNKLLKH